jgi:hypothetical protein
MIFATPFEAGFAAALARLAIQRIWILLVCPLFEE